MGITKSKIILVFACGLAFILKAGLAFSADAAKPQVCFKDTCIDVEVVTTPQDLERGLSGREGLEPGHGMLFVFTADDLYRFWMKDMKFSLDILWINAQGKVIFIAPDLAPCVPQACPTYAPPENARYVLEIKAGSSAGIHPGSHAELKGIGG